MLLEAMGDPELDILDLFWYLCFNKTFEGIFIEDRNFQIIMNRCEMGMLVHDVQGFSPENMPSIMYAIQR
jgi:hypothetical protein